MRNAPNAPKNTPIPIFSCGDSPEDEEGDRLGAVLELLVLAVFCDGEVDVNVVLKEDVNGKSVEMELRMLVDSQCVEFPKYCTHLVLVDLVELDEANREELLSAETMEKRPLAV